MVSPLQAPLADLFSRRELERAPVGKDFGRCLLQVHNLWEKAGGERTLGTADLSCFLPMPKLGSWSWQVTSPPCLSHVCKHETRMHASMQASMSLHSDGCGRGLSVNWRR